MLRTLRWTLSIAVLIAAAALVTTTLISAKHRREQERAQEASSSTGVPAPLAMGSAIDVRLPPDLNLLDEQGHRTSLAAFHGRWLVLAPSMTLCHEVCPMTTGALEQLQDLLKQQGLSKQVVIAEASVDPWRDTPARLRAYKRLTGTTLRELTGTHAELHKLWRTFGIQYLRVRQDNPPDTDWLTHKPETMDVQHEDGLFIVDPAGNERVEDVGMPNVQGHLSKVLRSLLNDQGRQNLAHPQLSWTARDAMNDIDHLLGRTIPASEAPKTTAPTPAAAAADLKGAPAQLAALHAQGSKILPGGIDALNARVRALKGTPVVINAWASWCPPCRAEFSEFGAVSASYGRKVAFLGADVNDGASAGQKFLDGHPVSYPSYSDPETTSLGGLAPLPGTPTTVFVNASGKVAFIHPGEYDTEATLVHDVEQYALGKGAS